MISTRTAENITTIFFRINMFIESYLPSEETLKVLYAILQHIVYLSEHFLEAQTLNELFK